MFSLQDAAAITENQKLHQFSHWGPHFDISFDFLLEKTENNGTFVNVLTFTQNIGQCCNLGDRIPGIYLKTDTQNFHIVTQIGQDINKQLTSIQKYDVNVWNHFEVRQYKYIDWHEDGEKMVRR